MGQRRRRTRVTERFRPPTFGAPPLPKTRGRDRPGPAVDSPGAEMPLPLPTTPTVITSAPTVSGKNLNDGPHVEFSKHSHERTGRRQTNFINKNRKENRNVNQIIMHNNA